jgi:hypothetical protein
MFSAKNDIAVIDMLINKYIKLTFMDSLYLIIGWHTE